MRISAVILDLDGTLIDSESVSKQSWEQAAKDFGFEFSFSLYSKIAGGTIKSARKKIEHHTQGQVDMDLFMNHARDIYLETLETNGIEVMDGAIELLEFLDRSNIKSTVATSTERRYVDRKMVLSGLIGRIDVTVTGDEVENGKPAPDIFLKSSRIISVPADQCIVIEDAQAGIEGAYSAGMTPIMVPGTVSPSQQVRALAYAVVPTLHEVCSILEANL